MHGFNVSFADAARRTAQLAYDLQLDGAAGFYSWPSRGVPDLLGYTHDENSVQWTVPHLVAFLEELARDSGAERIHLIAHSMGNRALAAALQEIAWKMAAHPAPPSFAEVILTAPDIDAEVFRGLAQAMRPTARRMTLYASGRDRALKVSHGIHGYGRAGDVEPEIVVVDGLDSIDASAVDTGLLGHSYFADQRSVISDIFYLRARRAAAGETPRSLAADRARRAASGPSRRSPTPTPRSTARPGAGRRAPRRSPRGPSCRPRSARRRSPRARRAAKSSRCMARSGQAG